MVLTNHISTRIVVIVKIITKHESFVIKIKSIERQHMNLFLWTTYFTAVTTLNDFCKIQTLIFLDNLFHHINCTKWYIQDSSIFHLQSKWVLPLHQRSNGDNNFKQNDKWKHMGVSLLNKTDHCIRFGNCKCGPTYFIMTVKLVIIKSHHILLFCDCLKSPSKNTFFVITNRSYHKILFFLLIALVVTKHHFNYLLR